MTVMKREGGRQWPWRRGGGIGWEVMWCGPLEAGGSGREEGEVKNTVCELPSTETRKTERGADSKGKSCVLEMLGYKHRETTSVHKQSRSGGKTKTAYTFGQ